MAPATGSGPSGSYLGYDFRAAYAPGVSLTGAGQALALVEFGGYYTNDITQYENLANLPNVKLTNVIVDGFTDNPATDSDSEEPLDIEMAIAMAPGLSEVLVYEAPADSNTDDILNQIAVDNLASQISSSWTYAMEATIEQIYQQYAAQGQSFFQSSGDNGAYTSLCPSQAQADSPYATLVGGTTLTTTVPGGSLVCGNRLEPMHRHRTVRHEVCQWRRNQHQLHDALLATRNRHDTQSRFDFHAQCSRCRDGCRRHLRDLR